MGLILGSKNKILPLKSSVITSDSKKNLDNIGTVIVEKEFPKLNSRLHRGGFCQFPFRWIYYFCAIVVNPPERNISKRTSLDWSTDHKLTVSKVNIG